MRKGVVPKPKEPTPRSRNRFRERELARALRAAKKVGGERVELDPQTGKIVILLDKRSTTDKPDDTPEGVLSNL